MKQREFITFLILCWALCFGIVVLCAGLKETLLATGIFSTLFYIGMKITSAANAVVGVNFKLEQTIYYDIIFIMISTICFSVYAGLI